MYVGEPSRRFSIRAVVILTVLGVFLWLVAPVSARAAEEIAPAGGTGEVPPGTDVITGHADRVLPESELPTDEVPAHIQPQDQLNAVPQNGLQAHSGSGINIVWTNRGPGDGFDTIFTNPATADLARANVDAAIDAWEQVITALNRPSDTSDNTIEVTVNMNAGATSTSCGGSANGGFDGDGWPTGGPINVNGNAGVWFIDPTPSEYSEFAGNIDNAFSGDAHSGSPAAGLCDIYTVVGAEIIHILGITSDGGSRFQTGGFNQQLTMTGTTCSGPGDLWQFTGATITHLMTSNNGGNSGSDFGVPVHTAEPCATSSGLSGANDGGNAIFEGSRRYLPANTVSFILKDVYNFGIASPESFGTFYSNLDTSTGELLVRGGDDNDNSDDVVSITRSGGEIAVSVDVGNDIAGTGPTDAYVSRYDEGDVQSITVDGIDGDDTLTMGEDLGVPVAIDGGDGDDAIISGGGTPTVSDGAGDDLIDLSKNSSPVNYTTDGGNDTVIGTIFDDAITGSSGADILIGGLGDDTLDGAGGDDEVFGEGGSDLFVWNSGDGSDLVEAGTGVNDRLELTGSAVSESVSLSPTPGSRVEIDVGASALDVANIEDFDVALAAAGDTITIGDLSTTAARSVAVDLGTGLDSAVVVGTGTDDVLSVDSTGSGDVDVSGLVYSVAIDGSGNDDALFLNGGDGSDTVVVNGSPISDAIDVGDLSPTSAEVSGAVGYLVTAIGELLMLDGEGGSDSLTVETPAGASTITLDPGPTSDSGAISVTGQIPLEFRQITSTVDLDDVSGQTDGLVYNGTSGADNFDVQSGSGAIALNDQTQVIPTGIADLELRGLAGDDTFSAAATLPFMTTVTNGGDSIAGDSVSLTGAGGAVSVDLGGGEVSGYGGTVILTQIEDLTTSQTGAGGTDLTVLGTAGDDLMTYTPAGPDSGHVAIASHIPELSFSGVGGIFTADPAGGSDDVTVLGTNGADTFGVVASGTSTVQANSTLTVQIPQTTTEVTSVESLDGADFIDVTTFDDVSMFFEVDGGQPESKKNSDTMHVTNGTGQAKDVKFLDEKSHVKEAGSVLVSYKTTGEETRIDYLSVEKLKFFR